MQADRQTLLHPAVLRTSLLCMHVLLVAVCADQTAVRSDGIDLDALPPLTLHEEVRIGSVEDPDVGFSRIGAADVDAEGNLFVFEGQDRQIRVYAPDGRLLRRIGGPGNGPGEFGGGIRLGVRGDTLWTIEVFNRRMTLFRRDGQLLRASVFEHVTMPLHTPGRTAVIAPEELGADGLFIAYRGSMRQLGPASVDPASIADSVYVPRVRFDGEGRVVDTLGTYPLPRPRVREEFIEVGRSTYPVPEPMSADPQLIPVADGLIRVEQAMPPGAAVMTVTRMNLDGDTLRTRTFAYRPRRYTDEELNATARDWIGRVGESMVMTQTGVRTVEQHAGDSAAAIPRMRAAMRFPDTHPPLLSTRITRDGALWLHRENAGDTMWRWTVLDAADTPVGELVLDRRTQFLVIRDSTLWAAERDSLDVPWLVRYTIRR